MNDDRIGHLARCGQQVVRQRAGLEAAIRAVAELLHQRCAQPLRERAANLAVGERRVEQLAGVVRCHVAVNAHAPGGTVDFQTAQVEREAIACRRVDTVLLVRSVKVWRRPEHGFAQARFLTGRQQLRRPVRRIARSAGKHHGGLGGISARDAPLGEDQFGWVAVELRGHDAGQLVANACCGQMDRACHGSRKPAGIIAGGHRPCVFVGIEFDIDDDLGRVDAKHVGHDLRADSHVALPGGRGRNRHHHTAQQVDTDRGACNGAVLRAGLAACLGRRGRSDVAHVRHRGLDNRRKADAIEPPFGPRDVTAALQFVVGACFQRARHRQLVVAGIEQRAGCSAIGKGVGRNEVTAVDVERIEVEFDRDPLHEPLKREIHLRSAEAAYEAGGRLVG